MSLQIGTKNVDGKFAIALDGSFDSSTFIGVRKAGNDALKSASRIIEIDLENVDYLDSSALGMLLLLREKARALDKVVTLNRCHGLALKVLNVANFDKLFTMH